MPTDLQRRIMQVTGPIPADDSHALRDQPPAWRVLEEHRDEGDIVRRKIAFEPEPGDTCFAWLMMPQSRAAADAKPGPGMLCLHQTTKIGKDEPAGLGGKDNLHYARELTQRGYVTLSPDYPGYGDYTIDCYAMGYESATGKGIWNHLRAADLLLSLPMVDADRVGCIGHSLGGHNTLFVCAFDERLKVAVSSGGFTMWAWNDNERRGEPGDLSDWTHRGYMPWIKERFDARAENMPFDWDELIGSFCPRGVFINAPEQDFMEVEGNRECERILRPKWEAAGVGDRFAFAYPDCEHDFPPDVREQAYAMIDKVIGPA